jgi:four helix bundle protein
MAEKEIETLKLWQKAIKFARLICKDVLAVIPKEEKYALIPQLRRAAQSVPANIAEGFGRYYYQDNVRFYYIARGSLEEAFNHLMLARNLGYLDLNMWESIESDINKLRRL